MMIGQFHEVRRGSRTNLRWRDERPAPHDDEGETGSVSALSGRLGYVGRNPLEMEIKALLFREFESETRGVIGGVGGRRKS
jgi:hypothetical protein